MLTRQELDNQLSNLKKTSHAKLVKFQINYLEQQIVSLLDKTGKFLNRTRLSINLCRLGNLTQEAIDYLEELGFKIHDGDWEADYSFYAYRKF